MAQPDGVATLFISALAAAISSAGCGTVDVNEGFEEAGANTGATGGATGGAAGASSGGSAGEGGDGGESPQGGSGGAGADSGDGGTGGASANGGDGGTGGIPDPGPDPILFIHGVNGEASNYDVMIERFLADGWPADYLIARTFDDPSWGCNVDNADTIKVWVAEILQATGRPRIDLVAHSMGTLSSRTFVKNLGGSHSVNTYATLGGMHHGLASSCSPPFPFKPCIWTEICESDVFVGQLNEPPSTPGDLHWVSLYSKSDETIPVSSAMLPGAENIVFDGVDHSGANGLLEVEAVYQELKRVVEYPPW